jgi:type III pantothenate kinase
MNLVIDIGNTRTKFTVFNRGEEMISVPLDELRPSHINVLLDEHPAIDKAIVCAVKDYSPELKLCLNERFNTFIELNENTALPIENLYGSKETLGKDRLAAAVGAAHLYPGVNKLVIDSGTAITYDLVNDRNQYLGGNISPGLDMRYKALNHFTGRLPLVEYQEFPKLFGQTTTEAIQAGVQLGLIFEVDNAINAFKEFYKNLYVIITGGNIKIFDKKLKNSFFANYNLIAIGLNRILEHNGEI